MKNKYNSTKSSLEARYIDLKNKIAEAEGVLAAQKSDIDHYHKAIEAHRKQTWDRRIEFK